MKKIISVFLLLLMCFSCSKNEETDTTNNFDKTALLTNWADNIIVPSYINYQTKIADLVASSNAFAAIPTETNLLALRSTWIEAYKSYQYVAMYKFGKSEDIYFDEYTNKYPTNIVGINANITAGNYNLQTISQQEEQGLPAIDYLINGLGANNADIISYYTSNSNAENYKKYLKDICVRLKINIDLIVVDWKSTYRNSFIANSGTSVTGAVNITTNEFVKNLEKDIRTAKIGIPTGLFSNGTLFANKVEGFYKNDISKMLLITSIKASQDFFNGKHFSSNATGAGLKSYLDFLNATRNNQKLSDIINDQYANIFAVCNALNNSLSLQVITDNSKMIAANDVIQQNVVYTKLVMMQALNISIDYVDGDGD